MVGFTPDTLEWADFNGDGKVDLMVNDYGDYAHAFRQDHWVLLSQ